jgi:hypothetical protein
MAYFLNITDAFIFQIRIFKKCTSFFNVKYFSFICPDFVVLPNSFYIFVTVLC